ncbi:hypothetical protein AWB67_07650 [Caballeronia terrestris]|uniref:Uncharacterized protein n=2 Tax=Caballeronia terrestris TaxID=1226301 RepID=A0A158L5Z6_9BURK|nr:hypothetical protein AWB67_07650 [Caballeronia terrestris]
MGSANRAIGMPACYDEGRHPWNIIIFYGVEKKALDSVTYRMICKLFHGKKMCGGDGLVV